MKVEKLMKRAVKTCRPTDKLDVAARLMQENACGCAIVTDEKARPLAVVTDRDVCLAALQVDQPLREIEVTAAMSETLFACGYDAEVTDALSIMEEHHVRRLPVTGDAGELLGILSLDDVAMEAGRAKGLFARTVHARDVGLALATICRPHLVTG